MAAIIVDHDGENTPPRNFHHWFVKDGDETGKTWMISIAEITRQPSDFWWKWKFHSWTKWTHFHIHYAANERLDDVDVHDINSPYVATPFDV